MYLIPSISEPIRQGDIFRYLPKVDLLYGAANLPLLFDVEGRATDWLEAAENELSRTVNVIIKPTLGIVISQDCDASRCTNIVFAEVKPFKEIFASFSEPPTSKAVVSIVTEHSRKNQKWYYLAESVALRFDRKMGADFESIFEVNREMLEHYKDLMRIGRLNDDVAIPHFRERVAEYFRRYPFNEWYPLTADEARYYEGEKKKKDVHFTLDPYYDWQKP